MLFFVCKWKTVEDLGFDSLNKQWVGTFSQFRQLDHYFLLIIFFFLGKYIKKKARFEESLQKARLNRSPLSLSSVTATMDSNKLLEKINQVTTLPHLMLHTASQMGERRLQPALLLWYN